MNGQKYIHGYTDREAERLRDQANCLEELLHYDTVFPDGSKILEVGCGTGAQTKIITKRNPKSDFISFDRSSESLKMAKEMIKRENINNVQFVEADIFDLPYGNDSFDGILICFVLEHLPYPDKALKIMKNILKPEGTLIVIEGDHGSTYFYPYSEYAQKAIDCQIRLQSEKGGNALIGRKLYPLLTNAGFRNCTVSPRMVYVDSSRQQYVKGFSKNTFTAMIEGVREESLNKNLISENDFDKGIRDLYRTTMKDGVFCYTFFKAFAAR